MSSPGDGNAGGESRPLIPKREPKIRDILEEFGRHSAGINDPLSSNPFENSFQQAPQSHHEGTPRSIPSRSASTLGKSLRRRSSLRQFRRAGEAEASGSVGTPERVIMRDSHRRRNTFNDQRPLYHSNVSQDKALQGKGFMQTTEAARKRQNQKKELDSTTPFHTGVSILPQTPPEGSHSASWEQGGDERSWTQPRMRSRTLLSEQGSMRAMQAPPPYQAPPGDRLRRSVSMYGMPFGQPRTPISEDGRSIHVVDEIEEEVDRYSPKPRVHTAPFDGLSVEGREGPNLSAEPGPSEVASELEYGDGYHSKAEGKPKEKRDEEDDKSAMSELTEPGPLQMKPQETDRDGAKTEPVALEPSSKEEKRAENRDDSHQDHDSHNSAKGNEGVSAVELGERAGPTNQDSGRDGEKDNLYAAPSPAQPLNRTRELQSTSAHVVESHEPRELKALSEGMRKDSEEVKVIKMELQIVKKQIENIASPVGTAQRFKSLLHSVKELEELKDGFQQKADERLALIEDLYDRDERLDQMRRNLDSQKIIAERKMKKLELEKKDIECALNQKNKELAQSLKDAEQNRSNDVIERPETIREMSKHVASIEQLAKQNIDSIERCKAMLDSTDGRRDTLLNLRIGIHQVIDTLSQEIAELCEEVRSLKARIAHLEETSDKANDRTVSEANEEGAWYKRSFEKRYHESMAKLKRAEETIRSYRMVHPQWSIRDNEKLRCDLKSRDERIRMLEAECNKAQKDAESWKEESFIQKERADAIWEDTKMMIEAKDEDINRCIAEYRNHLPINDPDWWSVTRLQEKVKSREDTIRSMQLEMNKLAAERKRALDRHRDIETRGLLAVAREDAAGYGIPRYKTPREIAHRRKLVAVYRAKLAEQRVRDKAL